MRLRIDIRTPFRFGIEEEASYPPMMVEDEPHKITVLPPIAGPIVQTNRAWSPLPGKKSFQADTLVVEVNADDIDAPDENLPGNNLVDPLVDRAFEWANWFLMRYRDYKQAYFIQPVVRSQTIYGINYYPVQESPTATVKREQRDIHKILSTDLLLETWEGIANLGSVYKTPPWIQLLLDARFAAHPGVGVVLAWAALEMVIDYALGTRNKKYAREQNTEKQYTGLLKSLGWRSLKEEGALWRSFKDLEKLRHQFAHGRELKLNGEEKQRIERLIRSTRDIIAFVNKQLPPQSQWRMFPEYTGPYGEFAALTSTHFHPQEDTRPVAIASVHVSCWGLPCSLPT